MTTQNRFPIFQSNTKTTNKNKYMKYSKTLAVLCNLSLLTTGALAQPTLLGTVRPARETLHASDYVGTLKVFSTTEQRPDGDDTYRYPHTDYEIYKRNGTLFKRVDNGWTQLDETPTAVTLLKGRYFVQAQSETAGLIRVPVVIQTGRTTVVDLEHAKKMHPHVEVGAISK
jgi:hypothetical protein